MATWNIGDVSITKVLEMEKHWPFSALLPGAEEVIDDLDWLRPDFVTDEGRMKLSIHALVIESDGQTIIVDTCCGNNKDRPGAPAFDNLETDFLGELSRCGFSPTDVDVVLSTHLHVDHVGWNTQLIDGTWVPTFPNAEYLFVRPEFEHWAAEPQDYGPVFEDSVQPIIDAGLATVVEADHQITANISLELTAGHTPGHVSVVIESGNDMALITGDMTHHPVQFAHPEMASSADWRQDMSTATRFEAYKKWSDGRLVIGTHFAGRTAGRLKPVGDVWSFEVD
ncbi:MAG: MBL fold metallo-hydrolase [Acidimicrobiales bacterium]|jgi:glyoxylase-like metal-dependent hydrolase (beta-lactamase superfamily II)|nr:MBL fold metallo-hydrolase [Acidimicrobiales bacterium]HBV24838.1 MBL fold metallo-hydrolase [Acidimicrobiaceae bacterium]HCK74536.1 MBL fold metallo-hydrolase [Acidimicrobiaceae bacterium]|tara:strand:- start:10260 stop:11105 length:846 start_codon:yes stop_codon:yes gene_type:complete